MSTILLVRVGCRVAEWFTELQGPVSKWGEVSERAISVL